ERGRRPRCTRDTGLGHAACRVIKRARLARRFSDQCTKRSFVTAACRRLQEELRPLRALDRPLVLETPLGIALPAFADQKLHRRLAHDAGIDALEPMIEEAQLIVAAFGGIERV